MFWLRFQELEVLTIFIVNETTSKIFNSKAAVDWFWCKGGLAKCHEYWSF